MFDHQANVRLRTPERSTQQICLGTRFAHLAVIGDAPVRALLSADRNALAMVVAGGGVAAPLVARIGPWRPLVEHLPFVLAGYS
jgi:hypothetical protein